MSEEHVRLTGPQRKALQIVAQHAPIHPKQFAEVMWPDSPCWRHSCRVGHGASRGAGMSLAAGGYLGKLARKGWIIMRYQFLGKEYRRLGYDLTDDGKKALDGLVLDQREEEHR